MAVAGRAATTGRDPPSFVHLEGRAVQASFLRKITAEKETPEIQNRATVDAIPYLKAQIERRKKEIKYLEKDVKEVAQHIGSAGPAVQVNYQAISTTA